MNSSKPKVLPQYITALCATVGALAMGAILGFSSPAGAILTNSNSTTGSLYLTDIQNSWFSSIISLGGLIGCPIAGYCINYFGRRGTILLSAIPVTIGWILIISAQNFAMLICGRILKGFYCGLISVTVPTYVSEFSSAHIRGKLGGCFQLMSVSGILFAYCIGAVFDSFRWIALICSIFPIICSILMIFNKETPNYLLSKGQHDEAEVSLKFFRGKNYSGIPTEIKAIELSLEQSKDKKATPKDIFKPQNFKPFLIVVGVMLFQQFCGITAVIFNMFIIFEKVGSGLSENMSSIIVGIMLVAATAVGSSIVDKAGRKVLLTISSAVMTISLLMLGIFFYFNTNDPLLAEKITWLPLLALIVYIVAFSIGYGPICWLLMSELFSPEIKDQAAGFANMLNWTGAFIVSLIFKPLQEAITDYGVYWLFAGSTLLSLVFVVVFVYETKGKTLQEINEHFRGQTALTHVEA